MVNLRRHSGVVLFRVLLPNFEILFQQKYENYRTLQLLKIGSRHFYSVERFSNFTNWLVLLHVYNYISLLLFYCYIIMYRAGATGVCVCGGGGGGGGGVTPPEIIFQASVGRTAISVGRQKYF